MIYNPILDSEDSYLKDFIDDKGEDTGLKKLQIYEAFFEDMECFEGDLATLEKSEHFQERVRLISQYRKTTELIKRAPPKKPS